MTTIYVYLNVIDIVPFVISLCNVDQLHQFVDASHSIYANLMEPNSLYEYRIETIGARGGVLNRMVELYPTSENDDSRYDLVHVSRGFVRHVLSDGNFNHVYISFKKLS